MVQMKKGPTQIAVKNPMCFFRLCLLLAPVFFLFNGNAYSQKLKPGFDLAELSELLCVSARTGGARSYVSDSNYIAEPRVYKLAYRSGEMGLKNLWELWGSGDHVAVICIRGTTTHPDSWLANFYAAMVPAKGELYLADNDTFRYMLSPDPRAAIHIGWLVATAFLSREILPAMDSAIKAGTKDFIITGHSQGGAISYLLTSYLVSLRESGRIPADVTIKTYCTAAPKPGNLYYAYDFELKTKGGWAFNVVNTEDWVPETPVSIQTVRDYSEVNPFKTAKSMMRRLSFPQNIVLKYVYNRLDKPSRRAQRNFEKYLGRLLGKEVRKRIKGLKFDGYYHSSHYVRTGQTILLKPDADYYRRFPNDESKIFIHHLHHPYIFMVNKNLLLKPAS